MSYEKIRVGDYLVIGSDRDWRVMEQFGSYRMLAKRFHTQKAAVTRAEQMNTAHEKRLASAQQGG